MADMIPKDRAIAALSEINKLRHEIERKLSDMGKDVCVPTVLYSCYKNVNLDLRYAIERAYEILNNG